MRDVLDKNFCFEGLSFIWYTPGVAYMGILFCFIIVNVSLFDSRGAVILG